MAYATAQDMIDRFGQAEMIRLSTPDDQDMETVQAEPIERALDEASATIDTYLRKRYAVPLDIAPPELRRAACVLARYDLSMGGNREPSEQVRLARKEAIDWLKGIADGAQLLDLEEIAPGDNSYAQMQDRRPVYGSRENAPFGTPIP